jgi:sec-independent protein translocase protein TatA
MNPLFALGLPTGGEWLFVVFIVVLLFGPSKLPGLARALGRSIGEFKRARQEFENEITNASTTPAVNASTSPVVDASKPKSPELEQPKMS